jgi:hypothetical protein
MQLIKCDFCGSVFKGAYLNSLKLSGLHLNDKLEIDIDVCNDCAKDIFKLIDKELKFKNKR